MQPNIHNIALSEGKKIGERKKILTKKFSNLMKIVNLQVFETQ